VVTDPRAMHKSRRPLPILGSASGTAWAVAVLAPDWAMPVCRLRSSAAPPETNGALNDVPHPAAYVLKGYVLTMDSPGAATHTIAFP